MKLSNLLRAKLVCLSIMWCFLSWAVYLNYYSESYLFSILTLAPSYSINIIDQIHNSSVKVFLNIQNGYSSLESFAFILSMILCITSALIISQLIYCIIRICVKGIHKS
ncbi:MAG: hypothetical protein PWP27_1374 [Clostridiales bacterium]|jgi:hypothetical protein|nr:hypothetical protein [Clostridiales bacterium]